MENQGPVKKRKIVGNCDVCCEKFTSKARKEVSCSFCDYSSCSPCLEKWILNQSGQDAHCMKCRRPWSEEFIRESLSAGFIRKDYKNHREKCLFDREMAIMPASQIMVTNYNMYQAMQQTINDRNDEIRNLTYQLNRLKNQQYYDVRSAEQLKSNNYRGNGSVQTATNSTTVRACTRDDCRGFLGQNWVCGVCDHRICKECCEDKGKLGSEIEHVCDPGTVASVKKIQTESKGCPKCLIRISKVDGCK
jgi:hypothetical protein